MSITHLLAGHLASHLKKEKQKQKISVSNRTSKYLECLQGNQHNHLKMSLCLCTLTYFIDIHSPLSHIIFVLDDWLLMLRHYVVLTDYKGGPHDTPFVCPLPCLDLRNECCGSSNRNIWSNRTQCRAPADQSIHIAFGMQ